MVSGTDISNQHECCDDSILISAIISFLQIIPLLSLRVFSFCFCICQWVREIFSIHSIFFSIYENWNQTVSNTFNYIVLIFCLRLNWSEIQHKRIWGYLVFIHKKIISIKNWSSFTIKKNYLSMDTTFCKKHLNVLWIDLPNFLFYLISFSNDHPIIGIQRKCK